MIKFEINGIYTTTSICDSSILFGFRVVKRTAKRLTLIEHRNGEDHGKTFVKGVTEYEGSESCLPKGNYSMAPTIRANKGFSYAELHAFLDNA